MVNTDTDIVLVSKNAHQKLYPASTTKIMTCLVAIENIKDFDAKVLVPYETLNEFNSDNINFNDVSSAAIEPLQDNLTYWDCLYSLMICSACDSANVLAYNVGGGSIETFVNMMNNTARRIGCKNTNFMNAHGLFDENNYTTAYDMYLITKYAIDNYPLFTKICRSTSYDMPPNKRYPDGYTKYTTNKLIKPNSEYYYDSVYGIKTGSINKYYYKSNDEWDYNNFEYGSRSLVTIAQQNGYTYLIVSLCAPYYNDDGSETEKQLSYVDHINLYNWAFGEFEYTLVISKNEQIMQVDVDKGLIDDTVGIVSSEDFYTLLPKSLDPTAIQQIRPTVEIIEAPIAKGEEIGKLGLKLNDEILANITLVTEKDIELDVVALYSEKLKKIVTAPQFIAIVIVLGMLVILYITAMCLRKNYRRKQVEMQRRHKVQTILPQKVKKHKNSRDENHRKSMRR